MNKIISFVSLAAVSLALASCGSPAEEIKDDAAAPAATAAAIEAAAPATWTPVMPAPGGYETTTTEGKPYSTVTLETDGSYSRVPATGPREAGIAKMTDGKLCFDPSGAANPERCYTLTQPAADGSFTVTDAQGVTLNVKPTAK
jgi:hypothetical protein